MAINKIIISGIVTEDPHCTTTRNGKAFATTTIAVARRFQPEDGPIYDLFRVCLWNGLAEHASINVSSGQTVSVEGRMECRIYTDSAGIERIVWEVFADRKIEVLTTAPDQEGYCRLVAA